MARMSAPNSFVPAHSKGLKPIFTMAAIRWPGMTNRSSLKPGEFSGFRGAGQPDAAAPGKFIGRGYPDCFMAFASVHVPNFMVQSAVRAEPDLLDRALALVEGDLPLWKIVAANQGALQEGIEFGMGGSQAKQFSSVEIRRRSPGLEKAAHAALLDVGWSISPRVED